MNSSNTNAPISSLNNGPEPVADELTDKRGNWLMYMLLALIAALVVGYTLLPKGQGAPLPAASTLTDASTASAASAQPTEPEPAALTAAVAAGPEPLAPAAAVPVAAKPGLARREAQPAATFSRPADGPEQGRPTATAAVAAVLPVTEPTAPATGTLNGRILDENGRPLIGATVLLKGSSAATSTDASGNYSLEVPTGTNNVLVFGYGGYEDQESITRGAQPVNVTLTPKAKSRRKR